MSPSSKLSHTLCVCVCVCVCVRIWAGYMEKQQKHQDHPHGHAPAQGLALKGLHTCFNDLLLLSWNFQYFFKQGTLIFFLPWPLQIMQLVLGNIRARSSIPGMQAHDILRVAVQRRLQGMSGRKGLRECQVLHIWHWMGGRQMLMHSIEEYRSYWRSGDEGGEGDQGVGKAHKTKRFYEEKNEEWSSWDLPCRHDQNKEIAKVSSEVITSIDVPICSPLSSPDTMLALGI